MAESDPNVGGIETGEASIRPSFRIATVEYSCVTMPSRKKDPNAPKGAMSAYFAFCTVERPKVLAEHPGLGVTDVAKILGARWKQLQPDEKMPFEEIARKDKERYNREMQHYIPPVIPHSERGKRKKKDPNAPKKPMSGYFFFMNAERGKLKEQQPELSITDQSSYLGRMWSQMTDSDKKPYLDMSDRDKARYAQEMKSYGARAY